MSCIFNMRRLLFMEKEQIFDRPDTAPQWTSVVLTIKKWATSSYAFAPRHKGIVSFSTYRPYLFKEDKIVEWFCSLVITSVAPDWNPALTTSWSFSLYFSSHYPERVLKNLTGLAPAFWNFHLKCRPHLKTPPLKQMFSFVFVCLRLPVAFFECFFCI